MNDIVLQVLVGSFKGGVPSKAQAVTAGLALLVTLEPGADISAEHDKVFCGSTHPTQMRHDQQELLESLGWHWEDLLESWYHFT